MKNRDSLAVSVTRMLMTDIHNQEIEKKSELAEDDVLTVLMQAAKKHQDSINQFQMGEREDLVAKEKAELKIIQSYLPKALTKEELRALVLKTISVVKASGENPDFGRVMREIMPKVKGRASGEVVSSLVKEELTK